MRLPVAERADEIHFQFARSLPYRRRLLLAFAFILAGLVLQIARLDHADWAVGLPISFIGVALLLVGGYRNTVETKGPAEAWRSARRAEVERILQISRRQGEWDQDAVDITNGTGFLALIGALLVLVLAAAILPGLVLKVSGASTGPGAAWWRHLAPLLVANFAALLLPFWLTGTRSVLKNGKLVNKATLLLAVADEFERLRRDGEVFDFQLQTVPTSEAAGQVPVDVKAAIRFADAPPGFLGLQMQIAINSVQGSDYPYFYGVLVAQSAFGGLRVAPPPRGLVVEPSTDADVHVAVIRQATTKKSGYHTDRAAARRILGFALEQARGQLRPR